MLTDESEIIKVTLSICARGEIKVEMSRSEYEKRFPDGDLVENVDLEEIIEDWDNVLDALDFEIDDVWCSIEENKITNIVK